MSKKIYTGVNGIARNVSKFYIGVNGVARKVKKAYVGVNGVARLFWDGGGSSVIPSWDFWSSVRGDSNHYNIAMFNYQVMYKENNKIAYFGVAIIKNLNGDTVCAHPIYMSPDPDATAFAYSSSSGTDHYRTPQTSIVGYENITWYVCYFPQRLSWRISSIRPVGILINSEDNPYEYDPTYNPDTESHQNKPFVDAITEAAYDLLDRIYSVPFESDYQTGVQYTLDVTDIQKTIRKAYGTYLYRNVSHYGSSVHVEYTSLSDNADTIISNLSSRLNNSGLIQVFVHEYGVEIEQANMSRVLNALLRWAKQTAHHYDYYYFITSGGDYSTSSDLEVVATIDSSGNITYDAYTPTDTDIPDIMFTAGMFADVMDNDSTFLTNLGIDL